MKKITETQTQQLYTFTRKHYIEYYDVQTELVDHLANGIEAQWEENPNVNFDDALNREFKKFGVFGFMDVLEQKQKALSKSYFKLLLKFSKEWFKLPKIALTITLFLIINWSTKFGKDVFLIFLTTLLVLCLMSVFKLKYNYKKRSEQKGKKWLFESIIFQAAGSNMFSGALNLINIINLTSLSIYSNFSYLFSFLLTLFIIGAYITLVVYPRQADSLLKKQYPEFEFIM